MFTHRDYAERMGAAFKNQIQADHFGNDRDLSMEGCSVKQFDPGSLELFEAGLTALEELTTRMEFHSHFSDDSKQNAASTHVNMDVLIKLLLQGGTFKRGSWMFDDTDGCAKQYRCALALYLLSMLAAIHGVVIDRAIGAPGHGKDLVDGLNAVDKRYLSGKMCVLGMPEMESEDRMTPVSMVEGVSKSLTVECARLCSLKSRKEGVKSEGKYAKREAAAQMRERHYHVCSESEATFSNLKMLVKGLKKGTKNGLLSMYNIRADPSLGLGKVAVRRIPCACDNCIYQLKKPLSERYSNSSNCHWYPIYEGLNDWQIVSIHSETEPSEEEIVEVNHVVLDSMTRNIISEIKPTNVGAFSTDDPDADGYYLVEFLTDPFRLDKDTALKEYDPPMLLRKDELVVTAKYFNKVPRASKWYTPSNIKTTVHIQQVILAGLSLLPISAADNRLPSYLTKAARRSADAKKAVRIAQSDHEIILEQLARRQIIDYEEEEERFENIEEDSEEDIDIEEDNSET